MVGLHQACLFKFLIPQVSYIGEYEPLINTAIVAPLSHTRLSSIPKERLQGQKVDKELLCYEKESLHIYQLIVENRSIQVQKETPFLLDFQLIKKLKFLFTCPVAHT